MQTENSGFSQDKQQKAMGKEYNNEIDANPGGNEYTAAFIMYCQKTLDSFRRVYDETYVPPTTSEPDFDDEDEEFELEQDGESDFDDDKEREALRELSNQFEQMLKEKAEFDKGEFGLEEDDEEDEPENREKEDLEDIFAQFEQMLKNEAESDNKLSESEEEGVSRSNGSNEKEALKDLLDQFEQMLDTEANNEEQDKQSQSDSYVQDEEIDQALSNVGEVVKSAKENLSIVEAFWEEPEPERTKLLAQAEITQDKFEQTVTRVGLHLYDVKDCLEGWGDLSMLPETYEQLLLANNELSGIFEKMYGKSTTDIPNTEKELVSEEEDDDWELDDDDWELDDDDDDDI